jgi:uncharacterized protein YecT (DUF1311 family)
MAMIAIACRPFFAAALMLGASLAATQAAALPANLDLDYDHFQLETNEMPELVSRTSVACLRRAGANDRATLACHLAEYAYVDRLLNQTWQRTTRRLNSADRGQLLQAQRRWLASRFEVCDGHTVCIEGGGLSAATTASCRINELRRRTQWLSYVASED